MMHTQPAYVPSTVWLGTPPMFAPPPKPVKLEKIIVQRPKRLVSIQLTTTEAVAGYLEENGESSATEIKLALRCATSTVCEMLIRLEQKGFVARSRGRVMTRNAGVWFWRSLKPYSQPVTQRQLIRDWLAANPWSAAGQIMDATGLSSMSTSLKRMVKLGVLQVEDRANRHGRLIKHYAVVAKP